MTATPRTEEALNDTAQDFRALGDAVKQDFNVLRQEAKARLDGYTQKVAQDANQNLDQLRDFAVQNPLRALTYAALGGVLVGLYLRR
jgi:ElaB/YqjD/DUF883 family membrane-anchored ribosome-binding protein